MANKLNFSTLSEMDEPKVVGEGRRRRWKSREANPTVQMSVRCKEDVYDRFRELCEVERRTNGEMIEEMLSVYLASKKTQTN